MVRPGPLSASDWRQAFKVISPGRKEVISKLFWHRQVYTSTTTTQLVFFNTNTTGITGNNSISGQLPNGNSFLIQAIGIYFELAPTNTLIATPASELDTGAIVDLQGLINTGWAELKIGEKDYGEWPIWKLQAGGGPHVALATHGTQTAPDAFNYQYAQNGPPDVRAVYTLPIPLAIPPQYNFTVTLNWAAARTLLPDQDPNVVVWLDGQLMRPVQ